MSAKWKRGPYGGEGWAIENGVFVCEHGLTPLSTDETRILLSRLEAKKSWIARAARREGVSPRIVAAIGWSETRLQNLGSNEVGAGGMFGMLASTATAMAGRTTTIDDLVRDPEFAARLCARLLRKQGERVGYPASDATNLPILASCYNAGCGTGKVRRSDTTPFRMVYDRGTDGGYLPRVMRAYNAIGDTFAPNWGAIAGFAIGAAVVGTVIVIVARRSGAS